MLSLIDNPLQITGAGRQVSCRFDEALYTDETPQQLGLVLPESLDRAVRKRKAEFIAGRYCAREALRQLDAQFHAPIGIGAKREPLWPAGCIGSITHTRGYAAALVASRSELRAVGMDSERWIKPDTAQDLARQILTTRDSSKELQELFASPAQHLTLVFSAKESLYKCLFPLVRRFFGFQTVAITPTPCDANGQGSFRFELLEDLHEDFRAGCSGQGSYCMREDLVHTAVLLAA